MDFLNKIIKVPLLIEPGLIVMVRLSLKLCDWFD